MYKTNKLVEKELSEKLKQTDVTSFTESFFTPFLLLKWRTYLMLIF